MLKHILNLKLVLTLSMVALTVTAWSFSIVSHAGTPSSLRVLALSNDESPNEVDVMSVNLDANGNAISILYQAPGAAPDQTPISTLEAGAKVMKTEILDGISFTIVKLSIEQGFNEVKGGYMDMAYRTDSLLGSMKTIRIRADSQGDSIILSQQVGKDANNPSSWQKFNSIFFAKGKHGIKSVTASWNPNFK